MFDDIVELYRDITGDEETEITPKTKVRGGLQLSSLGIAQLICEIEDSYDIELSAGELKSIKTVQDIVDCIEEKLSK
ncbi:MAG: acyl carrier protein [Ruminococcaceae bacterium]|nr:acyl carrier protein [Oscillospiraceae bacterium]